MKFCQAQAILSEASYDLINPNSDMSSLRMAVNQLYELFSEMTGIGISDFQEDIYLSNGKAVSVSSAAHCLLEMKRTAVFLRGIKKAIDDKIIETESRERISILYAGTGPYATLILPLLHLYRPEEIRIDLLDINEISLSSAVGLIQKIGYSDFISGVICADACTIQSSRKYDIIISETMQACLKKEPQLAIMQNLIPQMNIGGVFIPEEISIDAYLTDPKTEHNRLIAPDPEKSARPRIFLGNVFRVDKENLKTENLKNTLLLPASQDLFPELKLFTSIRVYADEMLGENNCSLNLPLKYYDFRAQKGTSVQLWYEQGATPGIKCRPEGSTAIVSQPGKYPRPDYYQLWKEKQAIISNSYA